MIELKDFYHDGFGWICRACERDSQTSTAPGSKHSRVFREGEAESKTPELAIRALAKWTDPSRQSLICPHCGISEVADKT